MPSIARRTRSAQTSSSLLLHSPEYHALSHRGTARHPPPQPTTHMHTHGHAQTRTRTYTHTHTSAPWPLAASGGPSSCQSCSCPQTTRPPVPPAAGPAAAPGRRSTLPAGLGAPPLPAADWTAGCPPWRGCLS